MRMHDISRRDLAPESPHEAGMEERVRDFEPPLENVQSRNANEPVRVGRLGTIGPRAGRDMDHFVTSASELFRHAVDRRLDPSDVRERVVRQEQDSHYVFRSSPTTDSGREPGTRYGWAPTSVANSTNAGLPTSSETSKPPDRR